MSVSHYAGDSDGASALHALWELGVTKLHPAYALSLAKFSQLLSHPAAVTFVAVDPDDKEKRPIGFALTYTIRSGSASNPAAQHLKGTLSALIVHPDHRNRGAGSALHDAAMEHLTSTVRDSFSKSTPPSTESIIHLGSVFPRIFPGLPALDVFKPAKAWFEKRGWQFDTDLSIDLYGRLPVNVDLDAFKKKPHSHGITFRPATPADEEGIMRLEKEFDSFTGWPDMFPKFFAAGKHGDIHLALAKDGTIIGATLAAIAPSPMHDAMAFPDMLGNKCGAIGCVGVSTQTRGEGAGVGMVAAALQELERRGADGCFIDWVSMKGFYERFGVSRWEAPYWASVKKVHAE